MHSFVRQRQADTGIRSDHLLTSRINLRSQQYETSEAKIRFLHELLRQMELAALRTAPEPIADPRFEIIGVVADIANQGTREATAPEAYVPLSVEGFGGYVVFLRTVGKPEAVISELTTKVLSMDRTVTPQYTLSMEYSLDQSQYSRPRFFMILLAVFAALGLVLVSIGCIA